MQYKMSIIFNNTEIIGITLHFVKLDLTCARTLYTFIFSPIKCKFSDIYIVSY